MDYSAYHQSPPSSRGAGGHHYSSPNKLQTPRANLRSCLRQGNFSSNRSTRSATSATSCPQQQQQSRGDDDDRSARSTPTITTGSVVSNDNDERQFMKLCKILATQHQSGKYSSSAQGTRQLLHYYIPSAQQRQLFFQSLRRNRAFLPMFPEPNEYPSFALTRYVDRVFGSLLERESSDIVVATSGLPSPTRIMQSTHPNYGQTQHQPIQHFSSLINKEVPPPPLEFTNNHPMMFSSPNNLQQSIRHLRSPINIPPPIESTNTFHGPMLFPPPSAARDEVGTSIDRVPPPIQPNSPMVYPVANAPVHIQPQPHQQQQQHHVSFPMYSPPDKTTRETTQRHHHHLPRPNHASTTTAEQPSLLTSMSTSRVFTIGEELNKTSHIQQHPSMNSKSLLNNTSTETTSLEGGYSSTMMPAAAEPSRIPSTTVTSPSIVTTNSTTVRKDDDRRSSKVVTTTSTGYQKFTNSNMLPPITPRENILYHLPSVAPSCCGSNSNEPLARRAKRKRPTYLQLYVKCERSEPYLQPSESMDIVTWYRNGNNEVTADRTLVVRGTTSLLDLIGGIIEAFGLYSDHSDACMKANASPSSLMAYNGVCFMSDVKATKIDEKSEALKLTPLPIPGFYYKYVEREVHGRSEMEKESLLSTDPVVFARTLVAQVLDKPLYQSQQGSASSSSSGIRTRLALVYCAPKREAYLSPRTQKGILPETIYHFQILLDGIVNEDDLPSSFTSQTAIRCVGSTGGVAGGSVIDSEEEIKDLNRTLWGNQDVIGLVNATSDPHCNLEQIIDVLGVPLFDNVGNQTLKELLLDRVLYHIYSGNLSLSVAKRTQRTVEKMQGTTEWLARGVEAITKGITSCVEDNDMTLFGGDDHFLDASMSRLSVNSSKSRATRRNSMKRYHKHA
jgi:hypothetical protein